MNVKKLNCSDCKIYTMKILYSQRVYNVFWIGDIVHSLIRDASIIHNNLPRRLYNENSTSCQDLISLSELQEV